MGSIIRSENIVRDFETAGGVVHVLRGISVDIPESGFTIIRGRSGSGKTTLINMLGVLDRPTSGKIWYRDREISSLSTAEQDELRRTEYGFVFQSTALIGMMTAYENVEFALRISGMKDAKERRERAMYCLRLVDMEKRSKHMPAQMSGGEQQRVAIARAIAHHPKVLFADEPTAELDTQMGIKVVGVFKLLIKQEGITVVMSTHDPNMMELANTVYTLEDGVVTNEANNANNG